MTLAIIPCRSGSKGLPNKNILPLCGKPLMNWSIDAALESGCFDSVIVTTDSEEYAEIARSAGADVPWLREGHLASDIARSSDVILDVLSRCENSGKKYDRFMLLQPTSPLRKAEHIRNAFAQMETQGAKAVVSVCESEHSPEWMNRLPDSKSLDCFISKDASGTPRQLTGKYFRINGAIYLADIEWYRHHIDFFAKGSYAMIMDDYSSVDIDTILDFQFAEFLLERAKLKGSTDA